MHRNSHCCASVSLQEGKARRQKVWSVVRTRFLAFFGIVYAIVLSYAAYVIRQPPGTYTAAGHAKRIAPLFATPVLFFLVYAVFSKLQSYLDQRSDRKLQRNEARLQKSINELRTATHYQRIEELLRKWDPSYAPMPDIAGINSGSGRNSPLDTHKKARTTQGLSSRSALANQAAIVATSAVSGAGSRVSSMLGKVISDVGKLFGDDPTILAMLEQSRINATQLEQRNALLRHENESLRQAIQVSGNAERIIEPTRRLQELEYAPDEAALGFGSPIASVERDEAVGPVTSKADGNEKDNGSNEDSSQDDVPHMPSRISAEESPMGDLHEHGPDQGSATLGTHRRRSQRLSNKG